MDWLVDFGIQEDQHSLGGIFKEKEHTISLGNFFWQRIFNSFMKHIQTLS
jgi:hypothetical protein